MKLKMIVAALMLLVSSYSVSALLCFHTPDIFDDLTTILMECPKNSSCFRVSEVGTIKFDDESLTTELNFAGCIESELCFPNPPCNQSEEAFAEMNMKFEKSSCCAACCTTDYCNDVPATEITNHYCLRSETPMQQPWTATIFVVSITAVFLAYC